jgi:molecular chaperone DnaK (HSP70)
MVHTKLQLDIGNTSNELDLALQALEGMDNLHYRHIKNSEVEPSYPIQSPEEIVQDYLHFVFEYLLSSVEQFTKQFLRHTSVDIVVTIPAEYGYRAKNSTFRALTQAGFNSDTFKELKSMMLVSEPEAAAIYTARYLIEEQGAKSLPKASS